MRIKKIYIKNFRSVENEALEFSDFNVFVGQNDSGKSNILRALDLFFNYGEGYEFNWNKDFCSFAKKLKNKAQEIIITLVIQPPTGFANQGPVRWTKVWRSSGLISDKEKILNEDKTELSGRSKTKHLLTNARLDYVPAIKSGDYFEELLAKIHDMLERTVEEEVRNAAASFTKSINDHTQTIVEDILDKLLLDSRIELPSNLRTLFSRLEFSSEHQGNTYSLSQRGDGIKARHIPIILSWLAKQAKTLSAKGRPRIATIWAYEEPENNLELSSSRKLAGEMLKQSEDIQMFISTHSPAFYSAAQHQDSKRVSIFSVSKGSKSYRTQARKIEPDCLYQLDESMGLMPFLTPYYDKAMKELDELKANQEDSVIITKPTIFLEGSTDKDILIRAFELHAPEQVDKIQFAAVEGQGGGAEWIVSQLAIWAYRNAQYPGVGLFDCDEAGRIGKNKALECLREKKTHRSKSLILPKPAHLVECCKSKFDVPCAIEEMFPAFVWNTAKTKGWLEERSELISIYGFNKTDITFNDHLLANVKNEASRLYITSKVKWSRKGNFAKYVCGLEQPEARSAFMAFEPLVHTLVKKLEL